MIAGTCQHFHVFSPKLSFTPAQVYLSICSYLRIDLSIYLSIYLFCLTPLRHRNLQKRCKTSLLFTFRLVNVLGATAACHFWRSEGPKMPRACHVFSILTCKCASRHSGVQFCQIQTSKSGPPLRCFVHFDLKMCFAPQRRAIFGHPNFQKSSETVSFLVFLLENVLRATAACNFSRLLRAATSAPAALASLLFDPTDTQIIEKTQRFVIFLTFRACRSSFY